MFSDNFFIWWICQVGWVLKSYCCLRSKCGLFVGRFKLFPYTVASKSEFIKKLEGFCSCNLHPLQDECERMKNIGVPTPTRFQKILFQNQVFECLGQSLSKWAITPAILNSPFCNFEKVIGYSLSVTSKTLQE